MYNVSRGCTEYDQGAKGNTVNGSVISWYSQEDHTRAESWKETGIKSRASRKGGSSRMGSDMNQGERCGPVCSLLCKFQAPVWEQQAITTGGVGSF